MMDDGWLYSDNVQNVQPAALWAKKIKMQRLPGATCLHLLSPLRVCCASDRPARLQGRELCGSDTHHKRVETNQLVALATPPLACVSPRAIPSTPPAEQQGADDQM